jgi:hypothetical protein
MTNSNTMDFTFSQHNVSGEYIASIFRIEIEPSKNPTEACGKLNAYISACFRAVFLLCLFSDTEGDDMFLRNVGISLNYTVLQPIRSY